MVIEHAYCASVVDKAGGNRVTKDEEKPIKKDEWRSMTHLLQNPNVVI